MIRELKFWWIVKAKKFPNSVHALRDYEEFVDIFCCVQLDSFTNVFSFIFLLFSFIDEYFLYSSCFSLYHFPRVGPASRSSWLIFVALTDVIDLDDRLLVPGAPTPRRPRQQPHHELQLWAFFSTPPPLSPPPPPFPFPFSVASFLLTPPAPYPSPSPPHPPLSLPLPPHPFPSASWFVMSELASWLFVGVYIPSFFLLSFSCLSFLYKVLSAIFLFSFYFS